PRSGCRRCSSVAAIPPRDHPQKETGRPMNSSPKPGQIAILAGGAALLIFSFLPWIDPDFGDSSNAWSEFGVFTWPALFGLIAAGTLAARLFGNVSLPEPVLTF